MEASDGLHRVPRHRIEPPPIGDVGPWWGNEFSSAGEALVLLTFLAPPDEQWTFILELIAAAADDDDILSHIAAGPIEGLLARHGPAVIDRVEDFAERSAKFRRILRGVCQHVMSDEIWARVCAARCGRN